MKPTCLPDRLLPFVAKAQATMPSIFSFIFSLTRCVGLAYRLTCNHSRGGLYGLHQCVLFICRSGNVPCCFLAVTGTACQISCECDVWLKGVAFGKPEHVRQVAKCSAHAQSKYVDVRP